MHTLSEIRILDRWEAKQSADLSFKNACDHRIVELEKENAGLRDRTSDLEADNEGLLERLARAERRYAALVEVVGTRTGQAKPIEQVVGPDPRD
jgi:predicted nuclease with TOPRIM domain